MEDTIAAVATAYGEGGIGIIRISGEEALPILQEIFEFHGDTDTFTSRRMTYGKIIDKEKNQIIDEVLAVYMKGPKTYTAEDVVEINCHGSMVSLRKTLALVLRKGARLAEPGEFTKRAFLNGRLDLSQAEAVIDMIRAKTDKSFDVAVSQLEGRLSLKVEEIRQKLLDLLVDITVNIDYPDEDIEEMTYEKLEESIIETQDMIEKLLETSSTGRMIREGIKIAIVGNPNVGKSSLMNGLVKVLDVVFIQLCQFGFRFFLDSLVSLFQDDIFKTYRGFAAAYRSLVFSVNNAGPYCHVAQLVGHVGHEVFLHGFASPVRDQLITDEFSILFRNGIWVLFPRVDLIQLCLDPTETDVRAEDE